jgi:hypothetical protein
VEERQVACGICWSRRRGRRIFADVADLSRHSSQAHPGLGYIPLKWIQEA